jgi:hypothetical protein
MSLSFIEQVATNMNIILHIIAKTQFGAFKLTTSYPCQFPMQIIANEQNVIVAFHSAID